MVKEAKLERKADEIVEKEREKMMEDLEKTSKAHETISEELAGKKSKKATKKLIEEETPIEIIEEEIPIEIIPELKRRGRFAGPTKEELLSVWDPKTKLGHEVKSGKIKNIDEILDKKQKILEAEIVDSLINIKSDLISIGQAKGKFGGGKRRAWRQTQRKTKEGNVPSFSTLAVVGDEKGHVGIGDGKAKETLPARDKAVRKAKLNILKIKRGCSAFNCACAELHTIPFKVEGKSGSVKIILIPAPQGTGLVVGDELKKILKLAGIADVYGKSFGKKRTTFNLVKACIHALKKTNPEIYKK